MKRYFSLLLLPLAMSVQGQISSDSHLANSTTELMVQIYKHFDLSTIDTSFGPSITDDKKYLSDFYARDEISIHPNRLTIEEEDWFYSFDLKARGDFNNDGIEDIKIEMTDQALKGIYLTICEIVLTKLDEASDVVSISSSTLYKR
ncbi:MAG: hypothetical protein ACFB0B_18295 [Thermonemataceae bacterium]